jgi:hypothetical protein
MAMLSAESNENGALRRRFHVLIHVLIANASVGGQAGAFFVDRGI